MEAALKACIHYLTIGVLVFATSDRAVVRSQSNAPWISGEQQSQLIAGLQSKLPPGWILTPRGLGAIPDEWRSLDSRTFQIDGRNGDRSFRTWFVPADWIGIRLPDPTRRRVVYWEGILQDSQYKSITVGEAAIHEAVHATGMNTPSLVNSGWFSAITRFGDRLDDIDRRTQELVRTFCATRDCVTEAAYSLIVLGVPARSLTRECAERGIGRAQEFCASALGYWGEPENVPLLNALVARPSVSAAVRRNAAFSLMKMADPSSGPALRLALQATSVADRLTTFVIASAIGRIRYAAAGPDLLDRLLRESDRFTQLRLASTLADVRYVPAVPAIQRLCSTTAISSDWLIANSGHRDYHALPEVALLRISAPWGAPTDQIRLLIMPPDTLTVRGSIQVAALIENVGNKDLPTLGMTSGVWVINGKEYPAIDRPRWDGNMNIAVNNLDIRAVDLSPAISAPGTHSVHYRLLGATSNQLTLDFRGVSR